MFLKAAVLTLAATLVSGLAIPDVDLDLDARDLDARALALAARQSTCTVNGQPLTCPST